VAVDTHRPQLEQLVQERLDQELAEIAEQLVEQLTAPDLVCSVCGQEPRLPQRRVCGGCHRRRSRELHAARRNGRTQGADDPHSVPRAARAGVDIDRAGDSLRRRETPPAPAAQVKRKPAAAASGNATMPYGIVNGTEPVAAADLVDHAKRAGRSRAAVQPAELEQWLVSEGLADRTPAGLVATGRGVELGGSLDA
jgi:hypothetical protein